ncbi:FAD-binding and (Fe-S)-binding domain-containing protein [Helicobacter bilis]|uniref:FAD-binding and (Fe-S)-binding domain-containing protein n=1 Tax=Helicobacter bilis TaxID=37372 RepID=UPI0026EC2F53|nr:FAD-binding and (Fe-S)-binding domain-containing protein [Helicobacter bilis]MCI7412018.1 FAD-binding oxidoreductase [Helicobacter bilis]MDD7295989.1 FAD-binding and (Fe-S)-binding domain-containing protein [Helicobacter bilis]MDY4399021.1 FAD-binding and (Fe-S)-binding domain-containing protein [Helicobacter bilis]
MTTQYRDFEGFIAQAKEIFKDRIYTDYLRRFAYGIDASCYAYVPRVVVRAVNENEIISLFALSQKYNTPLTFRAAGTSLSGQACSDSVLVLANAFWQDIEIIGNAESIKCSCGVIGVEANEALKPYGKKIGPDPATINNAMIGGIFSNNSSGMCCGVKQNSYNTIKSARFILHNGTILDTSENASPSENLESFLQTHKDKADSLLALREEILQDTELCELIKRKFAIKNTTGYSINALLDFSEIKDIINHLFIGAEGTLGFVSSVEYECVEDYAFKACALLFYKDLALGAKAVEILARNESLVSAAEIMDYACLDSAKGLENAPRELERIESGACAILVQLESSTQKELDSQIAYISKELESVPSLFGVHFSSDEKLMASWWKIRKALLPLAAGSRPSGSIVITEDICFPIHTFAQGIDSITKLFEKFHFQGIIFGHALSGNVHFIITPNLNDEKESRAFAEFMEAMVDSVIALQGSTKAEHGTGRMIAPFVEKEWGAKAYAINRRIKEIFDPHSLINPDVIISDNPQIHTQNLKQSSEVEDFINQCMECGFCEKVCPSRELTLTPRQRIAVRKEIARLEALLNGADSMDSKGVMESGVEVLEKSAHTNTTNAETTNAEKGGECGTKCGSIFELKSGLCEMSARSYLKGSAEARSEAIADFSQRDNAQKLKELKRDYQYFGVETCATCSMCSLSCPLEIDSGKIASKLSPATKGIFSRFVATQSAEHFSTTLSLAKGGLRIANFSSNMLGKNTLSNLSKKIKFLPYIPSSLPRANAYRLESKLDFTSNAQSQVAIIYFSTCINRSFAPQSSLKDTRALQEVFESLCKKANVSVVYPQNLNNLCCGKAYKDYPQSAEAKRKEVYKALESSVKELQSKGVEQIHIVCDHSACSYELKNGLKELDSTLTILDMPECIESTLLPRLHITPLDEDIALYAMCATKKGKWDKSLESIAKTCTSGEVIVHSKTRCCGFAGNKGFICSELNTSALRELSEFYADKQKGDSSGDSACGLESQIESEKIDSHLESTKESATQSNKGQRHKKLRLGFSSSSTCEIGLNDKTNIIWQNLLYLVDSVSVSKV